MPDDPTPAAAAAGPTRYAVNNVYPCVQGEGVLTGVPMVLLRLHGCGVRCHFCDTKETWQQGGREGTRFLRPTIAEALGEGPLWAWATGPEVAAAVRAADPHGAIRWVMLTGGEPAEQELGALVAALQAAGYRVALETSGTALGFLGAGVDHVCVSPKLNNPGGRMVRGAALAAADEIKFVVGKPADLDAAAALLELHPPKPGATVCLQPLSAQPKATALCLAECQRRGWRLSVQTHKYLGVA